MGSRPKPTEHMATSEVPEDRHQVAPTSPQPGPSGLQQTFPCEHCNKNFSSKFKLVRHILIHSDRRQFSCSVCERTFHRKDHLKNHIKVHSPTKKIHICDREHCKKEYTSILSYKKHLAIHFADEGHLDCKICGKKFENKSDLLYHLKIHAGSRTLKNPNEKKFRCEFCDRKFFTRKDVRRHLVVHTGRRDFLCQFCPQRFGRKDHLVRHIKKSHKEQDQIKKEIDSDDPGSFPGTSGEAFTNFALDFLCQFCPERFGRKDLLVRHIKKTHKEQDQIKMETDSDDLAESFPGTSGEAFTNFPEFALDSSFLYPATLPVLEETEILELISELPTEEDSKPLPGFSQAFQKDS